MSELRTNKIFPKDGLPVGASGGGIIQIVQKKITTLTVITTQANYTNLTNFDTSITPNSASNKILVECNPSAYLITNTSANSVYAGIRILRNGTPIYTPITDTTTGGPVDFGWGTGGTFNFGSIDQFSRPKLEVLDTPATTSSVTYTFQASLFLNSDGRTLEINRSAFKDPTGQSFVTLTEISG
jgi:hypothetical protein